jgi:hypothetical protein
MITWLIGKRSIITIVLVAVMAAGVLGDFDVVSVLGLDPPSHIDGLWDGPH